MSSGAKVVMVLVVIAVVVTILVLVFGKKSCDPACVNGKCKSGACSCDKGYGGTDCSQPAFYLRPPVGGTVSSGDELHYGDPVVLARSTDDGNTSDCGYYGCLVGQFNDVNLPFQQGGDAPSFFALRPPTDSSMDVSASIISGAAAAIAYGDSAGYTSNCGYYGCRVATLDVSGILHLNHGGESPTTFTFTRGDGNTSDPLKYGDSVVIAHDGKIGDLTTTAPQYLAFA